LLAAGAGEAATYYVRNGGNDSADGRTHDSAWASISKVNKTSFQSGDAVLFYENNTFTGQLTIDWGGTSSQPAVVGSYYLSNGTTTRGYKAGRPIIDGKNSSPSDHYDALVRVRADYVRVENLKVINSNGRAIDIADADHPVILGNYTDVAYNSGIHSLRSVSTIIENNYVTRAGTGMKSGSPWGGAIEIVRTTDAVVRNNIVKHVYGEGINANENANRTVIEKNFVFGARAVGIYSDAAPNTVIRRNVVSGTTNTDFWRTSKATGAGIAVNNESYHYSGNDALSTSVQSKNVQIYGNLVTGTSSGISVWGELSSSSFDNLWIFNNTLVDNDTQVSMQASPRPNGKFINNILLSLSTGTRDVSGTDLAGMTAKNNYFSRGNPGGGYVHSGNRFTGLSLSRMSGWRALKSETELTWRDFMVKAGSSVIGSGDEEPRTMASGSKNYNLDYNTAEHNAPMDIGGIRFSTATVNIPSSPQNLTLTE
jgi:hypothetical protein